MSNACFVRLELTCSQHSSLTWISLKRVKFVHSLNEKAVILYAQGWEPLVTTLKLQELLQSKSNGIGPRGNSGIA